MDESIYGLIQPVEEKKRKTARYKSKYPGMLAPTASTFVEPGSTQVGCTNITGSWRLQRSPKGKKKGGKKGEAEAGAAESPKFKYPGARKPKVPTGEEPPVFGLTTTKNFVKANKLAACLTEPLPRDGNVEFPKHAEYGKVPEYLSNIKEDIAAEMRHIADQEEAMQAGDKDGISLLPEEEKQRMLCLLKDKWEMVNHEYQNITHLVTLDTIGKVRRKERYEADLSQLEKDIEKLSKKYVFVKSRN